LKPKHEKLLSNCDFNCNPRPSSEGTRDKATGYLSFPDHPEFFPNLTPKQVIRAGSWYGGAGSPRVDPGFTPLGFNA